MQKKNLLFINENINKNEFYKKPSAPNLTYEQLLNQKSELLQVLAEKEEVESVRTVIMFLEFIVLVFLFYMVVSYDGYTTVLIEKIQSYRQLTKDLELVVAPLVELKQNNLLPTEIVKEDLVNMTQPGVIVPDNMEINDTNLIGLAIIYCSFLGVGLLLLARS